MKLPPPVVLGAAEARAYLTGQLQLRRVVGRGAPAARALLSRLRYIQLDPLDPWGTSNDLVALARVDDLGRGQLFDALYPGHAFEHFAKERCVLPASSFPHYRDQALETKWWNLAGRRRRVPARVVDAVLDEVRARGPIRAAELTDRGAVRPIWIGWSGTSRAAAMALEILWTRCQVVVCARQRNVRLYDIPERALSDVHARPFDGDFTRWALLERIEAAGLLARGGGAVWSTLSRAHTTALVARLLAEGTIEEVTVEGNPRRYLAPAGFRHREFPASDGRIRILAPLDPLLWDRTLVWQLFGFDYVWEVYKPEAARRWGWYVCPLLHGDELVGRVEGVVEGDRLVVRRLWRERGRRLDDDALDQALARHARSCGVEGVTRPRRARLEVSGAVGRAADPPPPSSRPRRAARRETR